MGWMSVDGRGLAVPASNQVSVSNLSKLTIIIAIIIVITIAITITIIIAITITIVIAIIIVIIIVDGGAFSQPDFFIINFYRTQDPSKSDQCQSLNN